MLDKVPSRLRQTTSARLCAFLHGFFAMFFHPLGTLPPRGWCPLISWEATIMMVHQNASLAEVSPELAVQFDLFGFPETRYSKEPSSRTITRRPRVLRSLENGCLDFFDLLKIPEWQIPVADLHDDDTELDVDIPCSLLGEAFLSTHDGKLSWSSEGIMELQVLLLRESIAELGLKNNDLDRASVLRWIFRPAAYQIWNMLPDGRYVSEDFNEEKDPFSFHNCCIASGNDEDDLREGIRTCLISEVEAVERLYMPTRH